MDIGAFDEKQMTCSKCGKRKPVSEFHKNRSNPYGIEYTCKECANAARRKRYVGKPDGIFYDPRRGRLIEHRGYSNKIYLNQNQRAWLIKHYPNTKNQELAETLGLSLRTMIRKARELGLQKSKEFIGSIGRENLFAMNVRNRKYGNGGMFQKGHKFTENQYVKIANNEKVRKTPGD